jgi:hypothetical protein
LQIGCRLFEAVDDIGTEGALMPESPMPQATRSLARIPLFRTLDPQDLQRVESSCAWREVAAQEWVLDREGEGSLCCEGICAWWFPSAAGRRSCAISTPASSLANWLRWT